MKKTIMLITLISFAFGQTTIDVTDDKPTEGFDWSVLNLSTRIITVKDTNDYELWKRMFDEKGLIQVTIYGIDTYFPTTLSYDIYAEECYNDSTVSYYRTLSGGLPLETWQVPCEKNSIDYWGNKCPEHWSHRKPTFEGFIEWLKTGE